MHFRRIHGEQTDALPADAYSVTVDAIAADKLADVNHYDQVRGLRLTSNQKSDLVE